MAAALAGRRADKERVIIFAWSAGDGIDARRGGMEVDVPDIQTSDVPSTAWPERAGVQGMFRHSRNSPVGVNARRLTLAALVIVISGVGASSQAGASVRAIHQEARVTLVAGDGEGDSNRVSMRTGNGKFNRNYASVLSPTVNRGLQQIATTNVSGRTNTQTAFCHKKHRVCRISQRQWVPFP